MSKKLPANLKLLLDFAPLLVFFFAYKLGGVMPATLGLMVATGISLSVIYAVERQLALAPLITGLVVMLMGGLTIALKDGQFIKIKPTIVNLVFAVILLIGVYVKKRGLLKLVLDVAFTLTEEGWRILSRRWGFFFLFLAALNECIWRNFSESFWVDFKVFGMLSCTVMFALCQMRLIQRYSIEE